jgi:hypothetical protein
LPAAFDLRAHVAHVADDGVRRRRQLGVGLAVFIEEAAVDAIGVGGDEIDRRAGRLHMRRELRHPGRAGGRRAADASVAGSTP